MISFSAIYGKRPFAFGKQVNADKHSSYVEIFWTGRQRIIDLDLRTTKYMASITREEHFYQWILQCVEVLKHWREENCAPTKRFVASINAVATAYSFSCCAKLLWIFQRVFPDVSEIIYI